MTHKLSPREFQCVEALMHGAKSYQAVADRLGISLKTVDTHLLNARKKYKVSSTTKLHLIGMQEGWL
jgi:DNA-binding CsgD family transcriptional regulator